MKGTFKAGAGFEEKMNYRIDNSNNAGKNG